MTIFFHHLLHYTIEIGPSIALGFLLSGIIHEFLPQNLVEKYLTRKSLLPILYVTILGAILPVCCFGSLPIAITFRKKGVPLGPVLAFLVATPATSVPAILVTWRLMGPLFTAYLCLSVLVMGLAIGIIGNRLKYSEIENIKEECPMCSEGNHKNHFHHQEGIRKRFISMLSYGFVDIPKEMGVELIIGVVLAASVVSIPAIGLFLKKYLFGFAGYIFALIFGLVMYICSTASVPLVHAFIKQGLSMGAGFVLLLAGPITSYGNVLVIKKEFGGKVLAVYLIFVSVASLILGYLFSFIAK
jgi:uncharacterized protein